MSWFSKISELHVKLATLFEKIDNLSGDISKLDDEHTQTAYEVARIRGTIDNNNSQEILRQLYEINSRLADMESRLSRIETDKAETKDSQLKQVSGPKS